VVMGCDEPLMGSRQLCLSAEETLFGKIQYVGSWMRPRPSSYLNINRNIYGGYPTTKPSPENAVDFIVRQVKANPHQVTLFNRSGDQYRLGGEKKPGDCAFDQKGYLYGRRHQDRGTLSGHRHELRS
jgi:hypothetical protein